MWRINRAGSRTATAGTAKGEAVPMERLRLLTKGVNIAWFRDKYEPQTFGWFEIRAKAWPPEIDVLEILGHEINKVHMNNHWKTATNPHGSKGGFFVGPDFSKDFHTFAVEWTPKELIWYVDGVERFRSEEQIPQEPMYLLANLAVGGDWPGNPDETTPFPGFMDVDYIRVYERK